MDDEITVRKVRNTLREKDYGHANELELQSGVGLVLAGMGLSIKREVRLGPADRIDIMTELPRPDGPGIRVGVEVKVQGTADAALRQLRRYAGHDQVDALILVTAMRGHLNQILPHVMPVTDGNAAGSFWTLDGTPFEIALVGRGGL